MVVAFICALTASAENRLYLEAVNVAEGGQQKVGVMLDNDIVCSNVAIDITLPAGLEMIETSAGIAKVEKSSRLHSTHGFNISRQTDGTWRLSITRSASSPYILAGSGALGYFYVEANGDLAEQDAMSFTGKGAGLVADESKPNNKTYAETVEESKVTNTTKYGLYVLSATERLDISQNQTTVTLGLENNSAVTGMELYVTVPAGITLSNPVAVGRASGKDVSLIRIGNTRTYKLLLEPQNGAVVAGTGSIVTFELAADRKVLINGSKIVFSDAVITTADAKSKDVQADKAVVELSTGVQVEASSTVTEVSVVKDEEFVIPVCIKNDGDITGLEAKLTLPENVEFVSIEKDAKRFPVGLDVAYTKGKILIAPANSVTLIPGEGVLFSIHLKATDNNVSGEVSLTDIVATPAYPTSINVDAFSVTVKRGAIRGDVNEDGVVNVLDAVEVYNIMRESLQ